MIIDKNNCVFQQKLVFNRRAAIASVVESCFNLLMPTAFKWVCYFQDDQRSLELLELILFGAGARASVLVFSCHVTNQEVAR